MFYLNLDSDSYLLSVSKTNTGGPTIDSLEGYDLSGHRVRAHRFDGTKLVLDEEKLSTLEKEQEERTSAEEQANAKMEQRNKMIELLPEILQVIKSTFPLPDELKEKIQEVI